MVSSSGFAIIPTALARSAAVSAQAKAVFIALTSHQGEKNITLAQLAKEVGTTPETTLRALEALTRRGWGAVLQASSPAVVLDDPGEASRDR